ncbi:MAG: hypothetical protein J6W93_07900 [Clostridia bacterium]|nr:hypothetical protein [Clostridia bacterium]
MRKLTFIRGRSAALSLRKLKVFIEDPYSGAVDIQGVKCRELGSVKNGKTEVFEIGEYGARVFVGGDLCLCAPYRVEPGFEDVRIEGSVQTFAGSGAVFVFNGQESAARELASTSAPKKTRSATVTRIVLAIVACAAVGGVIYSFVRKLTPKTFTVGEMSITVTRDFEERTTEEEGYELFCDRYSIYVEEIEFIYVPTAAIIDAKGFAEEIMANDPDVQDAEVKEKDGLVYCEYELYYSLYKVTNYYLTFFYKAESSFYVVQFASDTPDAWGENAFKYAHSVTFGN